MQKFLNNLSIRAKVLGLAMVLLGAVLVLAIYANMVMRQVGAELNVIARQDIPMTQALTHITESKLQQAILFERILRELSSRASGVSEVSLSEFRALHETLRIEIADAARFAGEAHGAAVTAEERNKFERLQTGLLQVGDRYDAYSSKLFELFPLTSGQAEKPQDALVLQIVNEEERLQKHITDMLYEIEAFTAKTALQTDTYEQRAAGLLLWISGISVVLGFIVSLAVSRSIIGRLRQTVAAIEKVAGGNLAAKPVLRDGKDEIGDLKEGVATMATQLREMVAGVGLMASQLSSASEELSVATTYAVNNIKKQESETDQVATAMNEMSATVAEVAQNVGATADSARQANEKTTQGHRLQMASVDSIRALSAQIEHSSEVIEKVEEDSANINTVLEVIKSIAEQTNLLALNAAIEAARAGEQGRGFAVVADEVRTLAGRTADSTAEIQTIIEKLQQGSRDAVETMQVSTAQAQTVVDQANEMGTLLTSVVSAISNINDMSTQIATAAEQQNVVTDEINSNVLRIRDISVENSTSTSQIAGSAQELSRMASELQSLLQRFTV